MGYFKKAWDFTKEVFGVGIDDSDVIEDSASHKTPNPPIEPITKSSQHKNKIIPFSSSNNAQESIGILIINSFEETHAITSELKARRPVIFSVDALDFAEARRVVDYVSGTVFGIDGNIKKVQDNRSIFIATPSHIAIDSIDKNGDRVRESAGVDVAL